MGIDSHLTVVAKVRAGFACVSMRAKCRDQARALRLQIRCSFVPMTTLPWRPTVISGPLGGGPISDCISVTTIGTRCGIDCLRLGLSLKLILGGDDEPACLRLQIHAHEPFTIS